MKTQKAPSQSERGQVIILLTVGIITLLAFFSLAVEGGMYYSDRRNAQGGADAAALSAARAICTGADAAQAALFAANMNGYDNNAVNNTVQVYSPPIHGSLTGDTTAVEVVITAVTDATFIKLFSDQELENTVYAVAQCGTTGNTPYVANILENSGIIILNPNAGKAAHIGGNGNVVVHGGDMFVNSSASNAIFANGKGNLEVEGNIYLAGGVKKPGQGTITPDPTTGVDQVTSSVFPGLNPPPKPEDSCTSVTIAGNQTATLDPGLYCSIHISSKSNVTLNPGIYWIESGGFSITGKGDVIAEGVTIYMGPDSGSAKIDGKGDLLITPPATGPYAGLTYYQDEANTSMLDITGNGDVSSLAGTFYVPSAQIQVTGNGDFTLSAQLIGNTLHTMGNGDIVVDYGEGVYYINPSSATISLTE